MSERRNMRLLKQLIYIITIFSLPILMFSCATLTPQPQANATVLPKSGDTVNLFNRVHAKSGDTVHLFHGGNVVAKEEFCVNEIVPVYRYYGRRYKYSSLVGKVRITGYVGDHYLEGIVVDGNIKTDDVAVKPKSACIIRLPETEDQ
jgi:hypothetical protein